MIHMSELILKELCFIESMIIIYIYLKRLASTMLLGS